MTLPTKDDIDGGSAFMRIALILALCASLSACTGQQANTATTIALISADSVYANAVAYQRFRLNREEITQGQFDAWDADAQFLRDQTKANIMTAKDLQGLLGQPQ